MPEQHVNEVEEWRPVVGYEGLYEVSSHGRVRSLTRLCRGKCDSLCRHNGTVLKAKTTRDGHQGISLSRERRYKSTNVHLLVLEAFVGPRPKGLQCCHNDGNEANNFVGNLRWDTPANNGSDKVKHGTSGKGERNPSAKLSVKDVLEIRNATPRYGYLLDLCRRYGIGKGTICQVRSRKTWAHIP